MYVSICMYVCVYVCMCDIHALAVLNVRGQVVDQILSYLLPALMKVCMYVCMCVHV
jgi:hypothetical protein